MNFGLTWLLGGAGLGKARLDKRAARLKIWILYANCNELYSKLSGGFARCAVMRVDEGNELPTNVHRARRREIGYQLLATSDKIAILEKWKK